MELDGENFGTKRDVVLTLYERNKDDVDSLVKFITLVQDKVDISGGHIRDVLTENVQPGTPSTELQKTTLEVYDEDPAETYTNIAREVGKRIDGDAPEMSTVGDHIRRWRDRRRDVKKYTMDPEVWENREYGAKKHRSSEPIPEEEQEEEEVIFGEEQPEPVEEEPEPEVEEKEEVVAEPEEDEDTVTFTVSDDEAISVIRGVLKFEDDDLARKLLEQY